MIVSELKLALSPILAGDSSDLKLVESSQNELALITDLLKTSASLQKLNQRSLLYSLRQTHGGSVEGLRSDAFRLNRLCERFEELYGDGPVGLLRAPARINILGEHVDYVSYLPTASLTFGSREKDMLMLYRITDVRRVRGASTAATYPLNSFDFDQLPSQNGEDTVAAWLSFLVQAGTPPPDWLNYVRGAVNFAAVKFGEHIRFGFDFLVDSVIPAGGGASSSSALVVLSSAAIRIANHIPYTPEELALDASKAEWYVGTRGGSMDHTTICLAKRDQAVLISYSSNRTRRLFLPGGRYRWLTFFSRPADKGREVMIEYNERAAVSRLLIPAVIDSWENTQPTRFAAWCESVDSFAGGDVAALERLEALIAELPTALSFETVESDYPDVLAMCARSFPALVNERARWPLQLRSRALHHLYEIKRVARATAILDSLNPDSTDKDQEAAMRLIGQLLNESHESLRDRYGVSNAEVEELAEIIRSASSVYGTRLMGGGFGGNVLALTTNEHAPDLIERVQSLYYESRERNGLSEGSIMISTPGDGLAQLSVKDVWRNAIEEFNSSPDRSLDRASPVLALLDLLGTQLKFDSIWPIIVAAGKGSRATASGMQTSKPLALIAGQAAIVHVLRNVHNGLGKTKQPLVIVSPDNEGEIRYALGREDVTYAIQSKALGTGDAVLSAYKQMESFEGCALVVWSTQPVIQPITFRRAATMASLFSDYKMVVPTTLRQGPYAPILRNNSGRVVSASETHLESANAIDFGETNIGLFILDNQTMFRALRDLRQRYWDEANVGYNRARNELGFPNELINYLAQLESGVFASSIADPREEQGIKTLEDVARCERFILELERTDDP